MIKYQNIFISECYKTAIRSYLVKLIAF